MIIDGWHRSSACANATCVEVSRSADEVKVRDSKDPDPVLAFEPEAWRKFIEQVRKGF